MIQVRNAIEADRLDLFKLAVLMHRETDFAGLNFDARKAVDRIGDWIVGPDKLMAVAVDGDEVVGMLAATRGKPWFSNDLMLSEDLFFVRESHRGGRTAYRLMQHFMGWASLARVTHVRAGIATGEPGKGAARLYEHFGFRCVGGSYSLFPDYSMEKAR